MKDIMGACPVCQKELFVTEYHCPECDITFKGHFKRCDLCNLPEDLIYFVKVFLKAEGNLKEVEKNIGISYPTIKSRLARINQILSLGKFKDLLKADDRLALLMDFKEGKISMEDLMDLI
ncbi:MAG: DUF2089 domain-containing protein [Spirochaetales bacterium]|nr:DUF2089 domain-containing protein [Spirochaetales bacterium]